MERDYGRVWNEHGDVPARALLASGLWLRLAIAGGCAVAAGLAALIGGGLPVVGAVGLVLGGGAVMPLAWRQAVAALKGSDEPAGDRAAAASRRAEPRLRGAMTLQSE